MLRSVTAMTAPRIIRVLPGLALAAIAAHLTSFALACQDPAEQADPAPPERALEGSWSRPHVEVVGHVEAPLLSIESLELGDAVEYYCFSPSTGRLLGSKRLELIPPKVIPGDFGYPTADWVASESHLAPSLLYGYHDGRTEHRSQFLLVGTGEGAGLHLQFSAFDVLPVPNGSASEFLSLVYVGDSGEWSLVKSAHDMSSVTPVDWPAGGSRPSRGLCFARPHSVRPEALVVHRNTDGLHSAGVLDVRGGGFKWWASLKHARGGLRVASSMQRVADTNPDWALAWGGEEYANSHAVGGVILIGPDGAQRHISASEVARAHYEASPDDSPARFPGGIALNREVMYVGLPGASVGLGVVLAYDIVAGKVVWESSIELNQRAESLGESLTYWPSFLGHDSVLVASSNGIRPAPGRVYVLNATTGAILGRVVLVEGVLQLIAH